MDTGYDCCYYPDVQRTALYDRHVQTGARIIPFAGWEMPVQYTGIIAEHLHTRQKAGLFDTSHMGEFLITGTSATADIDRLFTGRLRDLKIGRCRYGMLLNSGGGIVDDVIVFKKTANHYLMVVNAGTRAKDAAWITANISDGTDLADISAQTAMIALQGPASAKVLVSAVPGIDGLARFGFTTANLAGTEVTISRTGYTGEDGYEIFAPNPAATAIWDLLIAHDDVVAVGLGARDTLRLEKGLALYGNDIDEEHNPAEACLMRFVDIGKEFIGREALREHGEPVDVLTGFVCTSRRSPRPHHRVVVRDKVIGVVTSGAFSPTLKCGIGLCYIDVESAQEGVEVQVVSERSEIEATIRTPPFV